MNGNVRCAVVGRTGVRQIESELFNKDLQVDMSEFELVILLREMDVGISEQFNFWMATTFAIVVASYTAGDKLNQGFRIILVVLYAAACAVFYLRYMGAIESVLAIAGRLQELGSDFGPRVIPWASFLRRLVMLGGSLLAILIVLRPSLTVGVNDPDTSD